MELGHVESVGLRVEFVMDGTDPDDLSPDVSSFVIDSRLTSWIDKTAHSVSKQLAFASFRPDQESLGEECRHDC